MARITVEDCIDKFPSRFELVLVASNRARKLHSGENPTVEKDNDKNTVIALREIAKETIPIEQLKTDLIEEYQTTSFGEDDEILEEETDTIETTPENEEKLIQDHQNIEDFSTPIENNEQNINENQINEEKNESSDQEDQQD